MKINFQNTELKITAGLVSQFPRDRKPQIIFSGRSNVGKSSLLNTLIDRKSLARVSSAPGKTVTVNFYSVDSTLWLVDLPGYGFAKRSGKQRETFSGLTDSFLSENYGAKRLVIQLIDMKVGPTENDMLMLDWLERTGTPYFIAATKADKLNKTESAEALEGYSVLGKVIPFSALKKTGKDEIRQEILAFIGDR